MLQTDLAWAAGIIDGEGAIVIGSKASYRTKKGRPREGDPEVHRKTARLDLDVRVSNTDPRMIQRLIAIFGGSQIQWRPGDRPEWKQVYVWGVQGRQAARVVALVRAYLVIKGEQADVALAFAETISRRGVKHTDEQKEYRDSLAKQLRLVRQAV